MTSSARWKGSQSQRFIDDSLPLEGDARWVAFFMETCDPDLRAVQQPNRAALVDQLVREYGLGKKQRQTVEGYSASLGREYVRRKVEIVKSQPRRNAAGALMAALRDDWQPSIQFKTDALDETTRLEASRELAKRMGWEW